MKVKTCSWLDSNIRGGLNLLDDKIYPCCGPSKPIYDEENLDYTKIPTEELQEKRRELQKLINEGKACVGCEQIIEKEESEIDIGKIQYLSIGLFDTCNLRCKYCYFTDKQLSSPLKEHRKKLFPVVEHFAKGNLLKDNIGFGLAGGEPSLFDDVPETMDFIANNYPNPELSFLSNSSIKTRAAVIAEKFPKINKNIWKRLYTSIDCGTTETYKKIRGRDLFKAVSENIINYAKTGSFEEIILKYILMFDHSNTNDKDIFGFLLLFKQVSENQMGGGKMVMTIDYDMCNEQKIMDDEMIAAAGKLYYAAKNIFNVDVVYCGGALTPALKNGAIGIQKLEEYAQNYPNMKKSRYERKCLRKLSGKGFNFKNSLKGKFSITSENNHKVIKILGIKLKFKQNGKNNEE